MQAKKWVKIWLSLNLIIPILIVFNFVMDPLWIFNHSYPFNNIQKGFDERKQKTNYLKNHKNQYDSLLLGSSRTTYYNQNDFKDISVFNYAFSAAKPYEYIDFINYYKRHNKLKNIIIGIDYFDSLIKKNEKKLDQIKNNKKMIDEVENHTKFTYAMKNYSTINATKFSFTNLKNFITKYKGRRSYNRNNIVDVDKSSEEEVKRLATKRSKKYYRYISHYDLDFKHILHKIKNENKGATFYIYTTPLSKPFLDQIFSNTHLRENYFLWIEDLVKTFGKIYFTTYYNDLSLNYMKFSKDGDHYYPHVSKLITQYISNGYCNDNSINISNNIIVITKDNLEKSLKVLKKYNHIQID